MRLVLLAPYSPEINPAEHIWDALRKGFRSLESDSERMHSLTGFKWIASISLNAK